MLIAILAFVLVADATTAQGQEKRLQRDAQAPRWLDAVGKLQVPTIKFQGGRRKHHREDCSATLIAHRAGQHSDSIVTAWHCLESYSDLSKSITFTLEPWGSAPLIMTARRLADGGHMDADWAILRLDRQIPASKAQGLVLSRAPAASHTLLQMAGYSGDDGLGRNGLQLTYDPQCSITNKSPRYVSTDCLAYRGASGGAVVSLSDSGDAILEGIISQGDSDRLSIYVPTAQFIGEIHHLLALTAHQVGLHPSPP
jgi:hypothetical protein